MVTNSVLMVMMDYHDAYDGVDGAGGGEVRFVDLVLVDSVEGYFLLQSSWKTMATWTTTADY